MERNQSRFVLSIFSIADLCKPTPNCQKRYNVDPSFCLKVSSERGPESPFTACSFRLLIPFLSVPIGRSEKEGETP